MSMRSIPVPTALPAELAVVAYEDALIERLGHGPDSPYIEQCWLAITGPSATWMWRRLARLATEAQTSPVVVDTTDLMLSVGLGESLARNSIGARTVTRMTAFDLAQRAGRDGGVLAVRRALPRLSERQAQRLPLSARLYHEQSASATVGHSSRREEPGAPADGVAHPPRNVGRSAPHARFPSAAVDSDPAAVPAGVEL
jgi:hypothetical protein